MFTKASILFALVAVVARVAAATPPACLLAAVNTQSNPGALKAVCSGSNATMVEQYICNNCSSNAQAAMSYYSSVCGSVGVKINNATACSSSSSSSSASASATASSALGSGHASASGSGSASATSGNYAAATSGFNSTNGGATSGAPGATSAASAASATGGASAGATASSNPSTGVAARLGMDMVGMAAIGMFGAMLAF